jgi:hypothetical protein
MVKSLVCLGSLSLAALGTVTLGLVESALGDAASATASSGVVTLRPVTGSGSNNWAFSTPGAGTTINWISGPNSADGTIYGVQTSVPQQKFSLVGGVPLGKTFTPFSRNLPGPLLSHTITGGNGYSTATTVTLRGTPVSSWDAFWTVTATGTLGAPNSTLFPALAPSWGSQITGNDPWSLTSVDFSDITTPSYDLFFEASLQAGQFSPNGSIGLDASYQTASGQLDVLDISLDSAGAQVTSGVSSGMSLYALTSMDEGPTENPAELVSLSDIQTYLENNLDAQDNLTAPLTLGIVLDGLPVPTTDLGDGTVANISVDAIADDAAVGPVPEPSTFASLGAMGLIMAWRRRRSA